MLNLPNSLSLLRIAFIPALIVFFLLPFTQAPLWATVIFTVAALTDWLDGYLARKHNQASPFGAFIDPVADKLLVTVALILVLYKSPECYILIPVMVIIAREIIISALREWAASVGKSATIKVSFMGKIKTVIQMCAIGFLIFYQPLLGLPIFAIGTALLYLAMVLTVVSMVGYVRSVWPLLISRKLTEQKNRL